MEQQVSEVTHVSRYTVPGVRNNLLTMSVFKSGLSAGFFFRQLSTKFLKLVVKIPAGSLGGGSFTI
jgi:hypothetical protein